MAHAEDNGGVPASVAPATEISATVGPSNGELSDDNSLEVSDVSSDCGEISTDDDDSFESDIDGLDALSPADRAEQERFGAEYSGPTLENREASRLLVLMAHASTCPCRHQNESQREVCRSTKWMMLHVRDCPGTTSHYDVCPFPWCRKVKHLLYHLVSCQNPSSCDICSPDDHGLNLVHLRELNAHRFQSYREKLLSKFPATALKLAPRPQRAKGKQVQTDNGISPDRSAGKPEDTVNTTIKVDSTAESEHGKNRVMSPVETSAATEMVPAASMSQEATTDNNAATPLSKQESVDEETATDQCADQQNHEAASNGDSAGPEMPLVDNEGPANESHFANAKMTVEDSLPAPAEASAEIATKSKACSREYAKTAIKVGEPSEVQNSGDEGAPSAKEEPALPDSDAQIENSKARDNASGSPSKAQ